MPFTCAPDKVFNVWRNFLFSLVALIASFSLCTCSTDPGSTTSTTGASVTLTYDGADLDAKLNVVRLGGRSVTAFIYVAVFFLEGLQPATVLTTGLAATITSTTITLPAACANSATLLHYEDYTGYRLLTYSTDCSISDAEIVRVSATGTVSYQGNSRSLNGSGSGSSGGESGMGLTEHKVFVTSTQYTGNLGGLSGADTLCQTRAAAGSATASLTGGVWRAIASDSTTSAASRLNFNTGVPVVNTGGATIVSQTSQLWSGTLLTNIRTDEDGTILASGSVLTGSTSSGGSIPGLNCINWTSNANGDSGRIGLMNSTDSNWISSAVAGDCDVAHHLYCIYVND